ncbi:MAG: diphthine synthase [Nanoarchaeota archaeon]|jgi:diphthine synthase|nr:diphthine synthase [Nanoarchaeota archaeon]
MTLYLIGLGSNERTLTKEGMDAIAKCKKVYLEDYTVDFPYTHHQLEEIIGKKLHLANREKVENLSLVGESQKLNVALLIYGSPLTATTHITLIDECRLSKIKYKIMYNASIFDMVAETGLSFYKFGKVASMPGWKKSFEPTSFMKIVKDNMSIDAHSLILIDIGLPFEKALDQLKKAAAEYEIPLTKLVVCQSMGTSDRKILYRDLKELGTFDGVKSPYCIIIPSKMHFIEEQVLETFSKNKK